MTSSICFESCSLPEIWIQWYQHLRWSPMVPIFCYSYLCIIPFHLVSEMVWVTDKIQQKWCVVWDYIVKGTELPTYSFFNHSFGGKPAAIWWEHTLEQRPIKPRPPASSHVSELSNDPSAPVKTDDTALANFSIATSWKMPQETDPAKLLLNSWPSETM